MTSLVEPEEDRLAAWAAMLHGHLALTSVLDHELIAEVGLPLTWYDVLVNLHASGGRLRMQELARSIVLSKSGLTRLVDRMVAAGLVAREPCEGDRRGLLAVLTDAGRDALHGASPVHLRGIEEHFGRHVSPDEADVVRSVFERVLAALRDGGQCDVVEEAGVKLARFLGPGADGPRLGVVQGDAVADVTDTFGSDTVALLASGLDALERVAQVAVSAPTIALDEVQLLAPVQRPPKFLAIGLNYADHVAESATPRPEHQLWFNKQSTCVIGPHEPIHVPRASSIVDYEGELAFVIGRRCRHVSAADAPTVVAGYTVVNDVSVRDWQRRTPTMTMGKSFDTHGPMGPWLVTPDELPGRDPHGLRLRTWVNEDLRQDATTDLMIFDCWQMIEHLTTAFTLEPGDVISTGTPSGVGIARNPPLLLQAGDIVRIEIEGIGVLENPVIDEPAPSA